MASRDTVNFGRRARVVRSADAVAAGGSLNVPIVIFDDVRGRAFGSSLFTPAELERADRFRFDVSREEYLGARAILRSFLAPRVGLAPGAIRLKAERNEKPRLLDRECAGIDVSLSHSRGRVACGLLRCGEIGVDIETFDPGHGDVAALACRVLSETELDALGRVSRDDESWLFLRAWTRKEAVLKAAGVGLSVASDGFDVLRWSPSGVKDISPVVLGERLWTCESLSPAPDVELAVAYATG
jgi:4'-phosphopantetheinyl transferase